MAFLDTRLTKSREPMPQQQPTHALALMIGGDDKVMDKAAPPVVAAEHSAHDASGLHCDEAHAGIARQKLTQGLRFIGIAQPNTFRPLPETPSLHDVTRLKLGDGVSGLGAHGV